MKSTASLHGPAAMIELQCPECTGTVRLARDELVDGATVECRHCGMAAELRQEFETFAHKEQWFLADPLADRDADEGRRA